MLFSVSFQLSEAIILKRPLQCFNFFFEILSGKSLIKRTWKREIGLKKYPVIINCLN